jgi:uncharacterized protein GlcG (DUF336 family)
MARRTRIGVEQLEGRNLPAATATLAAGTLTVLGDGGDRINVFLDQSQLVVTDKGQELGRFANSAVTSIKITGGNGGNIIRISPYVTQAATIVGGVGPDDLIAGAGPTTLDGHLGTNDKLSGGPANDILIGGPGSDVLIGRGGTNSLDGGAGPDKIVQVHPNDIVTADPADQVSLAFDPATAADPPTPDLTDAATIAAAQVQQLLDRASAATPSRDAIIAIVDRNGRILGVRVEDGVSPLITGNAEKLTFAIDGAVAEARTGAFFGNAQAPLTSRTIQFISQSTITEREVNSDPSITDVTSTLRGPGYVAPVGVGGHFPPGVSNTPQVDLFEIEGTNRDTTAAPGPDGIIGTADDIPLAQRFNIDPAFVPPGQTLFPPVSYGRASGLQPQAEGRGIGTLPGGIPIYLPDASGTPAVVGGIGVFFPGTTGYASEENSSLSSTYDPSKPDRSLEAEYIAFAALGGAPAIGFGIGNIAGIPPVGGGIPLTPQNMRIDLVGVTLDIVGPGGIQGPQNLFRYGQALGQGVVNGTDKPVTPAVPTLDEDGQPLPISALTLPGKPVPAGWLVAPHAGVGVTTQDVVNIISSGIAQANLTRAAIRLPLDSRTRMVFAVTDETGNILGLFRMQDATVFSIDVAVAKARNVAYYANPGQLQTIDNVGAPAGTAFTNRTFRYLAEPRFPEGIDGDLPGVFSVLTDGGADLQTGRQIGPPLPASAYFRSVQGHDAFFPETNFHDPFNLANQNGIVFFPGSAPLYRDTPGGATGALIGGFGVSGDGVDQDDVVTFAGSFNYGVPLSTLRADQVTVSGVRLPYQKFNRNPED